MCRLVEADVQDEVSEAQVKYRAAGPVHDERQEHDGQDHNHLPEEEHDDTGNGVPGHRSRSSSHGRPATRACPTYSVMAVAGPHTMPEADTAPCWRVTDQRRG